MMEVVILKKDCKELSGNVECLREFALKNNLRMRDLDTLNNVSEDKLNLLLAPAKNSITWRCFKRVPDFLQKHFIEEIHGDSLNILIALGHIQRFVPIYEVTEKMLNTMLNDNGKCCICWITFLDNDKRSLCSNCNVCWCQECQKGLESMENILFI